MIVAIDTNVLLDILLADQAHLDESKKILEEYMVHSNLIISPIVYSELLVHFLKRYTEESAVIELDTFLNLFGINVEDFIREDFQLAAEAWLRFSDVKQVACSKCGAINNFNCKKCGHDIKWRNHMITDFLIGAHAQNNANVLLTRDRGYYKRYFNLRIIP